MAGTDPRVSRRAVLRGGALAGLALFVPIGRGGALGRGVAVAVDPDEPAFLSPEELETLRAVVARFVPGPPEDPDPGALEAGCAEAIDALLGAFGFDPPRIFAGGPFSDRGGSEVNHFESFLPLDAYEARAWRLRIEGSQGREELEFNGPVRGWQAIYREGLAALDDAAGDGRFADLPAPAQEAILRDGDDEAVAELVDVAFPHTLEAMYGAPEYGGNRDLVGWEFTNYDGDVQPRGWTREEVEQPDDPGPAELLPQVPAGVSASRLEILAALASPKAGHGMVVGSGGSLRELQARTTAVLDGVEGLGDRRARLEDAIAAVRASREGDADGR
jgi:hypothetical protein